MAIIHFQEAIREGSPVLISLVGLSSSGKTYSALRLARGLVGPTGRIGVIDTEEGRAKAYANVARPWLWAGLSPPFTPERYVEAIEDAERAALDCLILDSASHEWEGEGGILEMADAIPVQGLQKWAKPKARHKKFVRKLLRSRCHIIVCLRAKRKFVQEGKGKDATITEKGIVSVQELGFIYETTVQLVLRSYDDPKARGVPEIDKCPEDLLPAFPEGKQIDERAGAFIRDWVAGGAKVDSVQRTIVDDARAQAAGGLKALEAWFRGLPKDQQQRLHQTRAEWENCKSIAAEADRARAEDETAELRRRLETSQEGPSGEDPPPATDAGPDNPFAPGGAK